MRKSKMILDEIIDPILESFQESTSLKTIQPDPDYKPFSAWYSYGGLYNLIARLIPDGGSFVEIGVLHGASLNGMAKNLHSLGKDNCTLTGIDLFSKTPKWIVDKVGFCPDAKKVEQYLSWYPGKVQIIESDSSIVASEFPDASLDAIFIDGDHTYEGCLKDMEAWWPKIKDGGFMLGHDLKREQTVGKAVYFFRQKYNVVEHMIYRVGEWCFVLMK